jgi:hypothetical protein
MAIDLNFAPLLQPLAASRQVIAVEFHGHGPTADTDRPMTIEGLAGDVVALLGHLENADADRFQPRRSRRVRGRARLARVGKLIGASADAHRGRLLLVNGHQAGWSIGG